MGQADPGPESGPSRRVVEALTGVIVAVVVASGVVAVGVVTRDDQQSTADPGSDDSPSGVSDPGTTTPEEPSESDDEDEATDEPSDESPDEPGESQDDGPSGQFRPEVTTVELTVDRHEYTGRCPVTLTFEGRIETNTGPLEVDYEWQDADSNEVEGDRVRFGGPGAGAEPVPQGADVTHEVDVDDDATVVRTLEAIDPNVVTSDTVEAAVTCTPYAEIVKAGDDFDADPPEDGLCHRLQFEGSITVPHDMTVEYAWELPHGMTDGSGTLEFSDGGMQTRSVWKEWELGDVDGEYGYRLHITSPYDVTSELVTYDVSGCSEPAT